MELTRPELLRACTLRVLAPGKVGTGFFIGPGLVLTCAHVVGPRSTGQEIFLELGAKRVLGKVLALGATNPENAGSPSPDLAIIEFPEREHPFVLINEELQPGDSLYSWGFSDTYSAGESLSAVAEGFVHLSERIGDYLIKFKETQVRPGLSGSPLLNLRSGAVCGVVKSSRDLSSDLGGLAVPINSATHLYPEIAQIQQRFRRSKSEWSGDSALNGLLSTPLSNRVLAHYIGTAENPVPFGGRLRELETLDNWAHDGTMPGYALLCSRAGVGKSALLAQWVTKSSKEAIPGLKSHTIVYCPISARFKTNTEVLVMRTLATALLRIYGESEPSLPAYDAALNRQIFLEYISRRPRSDHTIILVLDGLDEAAGWEVGPDLFPETCPPHLKFIVSARPYAGDRGPEGWLRRLDWSKKKCVMITLGDLTRAGVREVVGSAQLLSSGHHTSSSLSEQLYKLTLGDPLVLRLYIEHLSQSSSTYFRELLPLNAASRSYGRFF